MCEIPSLRTSRGRGGRPSGRQRLTQGIYWRRNSTAAFTTGTPDRYMSRKSFERINLKREINGNFYSCNSCKRPVPGAYAGILKGPGQYAEGRRHRLDGRHHWSQGRRHWLKGRCYKARWAPSQAGWGCVLDDESPNEIPDDYHVLDNVCDGPSRTS